MQHPPKEDQKAAVNGRKLLLAFLAVSAIVALLHTANHYLNLNLGASLLSASRWMCIGVLLGWTWARKSLTTSILVSMIVGIEVGYDFPVFSQGLNVFSKVFLRLIKTIVAPLLFGTLVVGIAGHSNLRQLGRMGWKSLLYFEVITTIALFIGLGAIHLTQAGSGVKHHEEPSKIVEAQAEELSYKIDTKKNTVEIYKDGKQLTVANAPAKQKSEDIILHIFPENISKAIFEGAILQIVIFSILFGIALLLVAEKFRTTMLDFAEGLSEVMFKFTNLVMYMAPLAVGAAMAVTVGHSGLDILRNLFMLLVTLYSALIVLVLGVLFPVALIIGLPFLKFLKAISEPVSIAFATTSSEAALPKAMKVMEGFGVPRKIVSFVMPMGYSFNLDGTTLYLSLATMFVAQAANIHLDFSTQLSILFMLMITSKGVAAVPRASLVILMGTASSFGLPDWPIYLILGIDELMDMARTSVNVVGNCLATAVIAKWEGEVEKF